MNIYHIDVEICVMKENDGDGHRGFVDLCVMISFRFLKSASSQRENFSQSFLYMDDWDNLSTTTSNTMNERNDQFVWK